MPIPAAVAVPVAVGAGVAADVGIVLSAIMMSSTHMRLRWLPPSLRTYC